MLSTSFLFQTCETCQTVARTPWHSTEKKGQVLVFDALFASAIVLSGSSINSVQKLLAFCNMGSISLSAFHRIARNVIHPVIDEVFDETLKANRTAALSASPEGLVIAGQLFLCISLAPRRVVYHELIPKDIFLLFFKTCS